METETVQHGPARRAGTNASSKIFELLLILVLVVVRFVKYFQL